MVLLGGSIGAANAAATKPSSHQPRDVVCLQALCLPWAVNRWKHRHIPGGLPAANRQACCQAVGQGTLSNIIMLVGALALAAGPFSLPMIGDLPWILLYGMHEYAWRCQQKYGKVFKVCGGGSNRRELRT